MAALLGTRFWQAARRTAGKATTFGTRSENLPWEYLPRTRDSRWGLERGFGGFKVGVFVGEEDE